MTRPSRLPLHALRYLALQRIAGVLGALLCLGSQAGAQQTQEATPRQPPSTRPAESVIATSIATRVAGFERKDGFVPLWVDAHQSRLYAELPRDTLRALLFVTMATGLGSNPVGLDRGAQGNELSLIHIS